MVSDIKILSYATFSASKKQNTLKNIFAVSFYRKLGKYNKALSSLDKALRSFDENFEKEYPNVANRFFTLDSIYNDLKGRK